MRGGVMLTVRFDRPFRLALPPPYKYPVTSDLCSRVYFTSAFDFKMCHVSTESDVKRKQMSHLVS